MTDWEKLRRGTVPWTLDGYLETREWVATLMETPKDDWAVIDRKVQLGDKVLRFNQMHPVPQMLQHFMLRYGEDGGHHFLRWTLVSDFLSDNLDRLIQDQLVRETDDGEEMRPELVQALCELPYSEPHESKGGTFYRFGYDEVIARARELELT